MKAKLGKTMILLLMAFWMASSHAIDFPSPSQMFIDALQKGLSFQIKDLDIKQSKATDRFKEMIETLNQINDVPETYALRFRHDEKEYQCLGSIILNSPRLTVDRLPKEYQDRSGLVVVDDCRNALGELESAVKVQQYIVLALNRSLPIMDTTLHESYEVYKKMMRTTPEVQCVANDTNSQGVPRTQTYIHHIDAHIVFSTIFNTSSLMRDHQDGSISHTVDRAMLFNGDVDRDSLHEIKESLDFLVDSIEGLVTIGFSEKNCVKVKKEGLISMACFAGKSPVMKNFKDQRGVGLVEAYAQYDSFNVDRIILGAHGRSQVINENHYNLTYTLVFGEGEKRKLYKLATQYQRSPVGSVNECLIK